MKGPTDWEGVWAFGRLSLGLSEEELWALHPARYAALRKRWEEERRWTEERQDRRAAWMMAMVYNLYRTPGRPAFRTEDFLAGSERRESPMTPDEMLLQVSSIQKALEQKRD